MDMKVLLGTEPLATRAIPAKKPRPDAKAQPKAFAGKHWARKLEVYSLLPEQFLLDDLVPYCSSRETAKKLRIQYLQAHMCAYIDMGSGGYIAHKRPREDWRLPEPSYSPSSKTLAILSSLPQVFTVDAWHAQAGKSRSSAENAAMELHRNGWLTRKRVYLGDGTGGWWYEYEKTEKCA